jgi:membrane associated rhomboid family serine protease
VTREELLSVPSIIIASVVIVTVLAWLAEPIKRALILNPYRVRAKGEIHRVLTAGWLHGDTSHLVLNMLTFHFFAAEPLRVLGPVVFVAFYVSAVIVAFLPTTLRFMNERKYNSLGASGAVSAVMFSAILLQPTVKLHLLFLPFAIPAFAFAIGYLAYSMWHSRSGRDNVNHDAHLSGAAYGAVFTFLAAHERVVHAVRALLH